uniref:Fukutin n=1 Tax=Hirondellea gigas TaxID=1518452 RepID=A0A2P2IBA2_9CRUS
MGVRRSHIIVVLCVVFGLLLLDQLYLQYQLYHPQTPFAHSLQLDDVQQLIRASDDTGVTSVLFDPVIIHAFSNNAHLVNNPTVCVFLCHVVGPLIFAANYQDIKDKPLFIARLAQLGFTVTQFTNDEGHRTHIFLLRNGSPLHIVLLHWSNVGYFRQYRVTGPPQPMAKLKQYITKETWRTLNMDRAYKSLTTSEVTMDSVKMVIPSNVDSFVSSHATAKFLPCNETRARYFKLKHPEPQDNDQDQSFVHRSWKVLDKARAVLDMMGIPFWLSSGTLLGYYRQCEIFPWSQDVDIGIFIEDHQFKIVEEFKKHGLKHKHTFGRLSDSYELAFTLNGVKLDIFFFYTDGAAMWNGGCNKRGEKFKYMFPTFTLCWTEFLDMLVRVPCNTDEYIVANYGPNWFTPQKRWSYTDSPPNVVPNGYWPQEEWPEVMQTIS